MYSSSSGKEITTLQIYLQSQKPGLNGEVLHKPSKQWATVHIAIKNHLFKECLIMWGKKGII